MAWALYDLALLDNKNKRYDDAKTKFDETRALAQSVRLDDLIVLIDKGSSLVE